MQNISLILKFFEKDFLSKLFSLTLLYTLLPLSEIFLLMYIGDYFGKYLMLALAASTGLFGVFIAMVQSRKAIRNLKQKISLNTYPDMEFRILAGIFIGAILLISPGFITDFIGFLLFVPIVRNAVGGLITRRLDQRFKEVYEYLKLYEE